MMLKGQGIISLRLCELHEWCCFCGSTCSISVFINVKFYVSLLCHCQIQLSIHMLCLIVFGKLRSCLVLEDMLFGYFGSSVAFVYCSTMDALHTCARDGDLQGLSKLLEQGRSIDVKGTSLFLDLVLESMLYEVSVLLGLAS